MRIFLKPEPELNNFKIPTSGRNYVQIYEKPKFKKKKNSSFKFLFQQKSHGNSSPLAP